MSDAVEIKNISFSFNTPLGEHFVLNNISFSVAKGEFVTIAGPSGCGKSTLLSVIAGLLKPTEGVINIAQNQKCGYMLQKDYLFEWRSVFSNACLGEEIKGKLTPETRNFALSLFEKYGLKDYIRLHLQFPARIQRKPRLLSLCCCLVPGCQQSGRSAHL